MTPVAKAVVVDATVIAVSFVLDVDPGKALVAVGGVTASLVAWLAMGWWREREAAAADRHASVLRRLDDIDRKIAVIQTRHDKEDGAARERAARRTS